MNNKQVAHLWANRSKTSAQGSHFYFDGAVIYSYGPHFPVARLIESPDGESCVLFTTKDYSNTTARHKSIARAACSHLRVFLVDDVLKEVRGKQGFAKLERLEHARQEAEAKALSEREARIAKRRAKQLVDYPQKLQDWRNGGPLPRFHCDMPVALRVRGDLVETTKGAQVPVEAARVTFAFVQSRRETGWHRNGERHEIGHFQLDAVNPQGIVAGCHRIAWDEIDSFAQSQGWKA